MRLISEETFAGLIALLVKDEKVKVFQGLLMSEKVDDKKDNDKKEKKEGK
jgi:hypothetical protein